MCEFFEERSNIERIQYNLLPEEEKKTFQYNKEFVWKELFEEVFFGVIQKPNKNYLFKQNFYNFYQFYEFSKEIYEKKFSDRNCYHKPQDPITPRVAEEQMLLKRTPSVKPTVAVAYRTIPLKPTLSVVDRNIHSEPSQTKSTVTKKSKTKIKKSVDFTENYTKGEIESLVDLKKQKLTHFDLENENLFLLDESMFKHINACFDTSFVFTETGTDQNRKTVYLFHLHFIFDSEPQNSKQVTVYTTSKGYASIFCYHTKSVRSILDMGKFCRLSISIFTLFGLITLLIFSFIKWKILVMH